MTSFFSPAGVWSTRRFCFWNFSRWKKVFFETVFHISENGAQISWPPSNMVMVAEKPLS